MRKYLILSLAILLVTLISCSLDPAVVNNLEAGQEETDGDLITLMDGAYSSMEESEYMGRNYILAGEIRADNVFANNSTGRWSQMSKMQVQYTNSNSGDMFRRIYSTVSNPNILIGLDMDDIEGEEADKDHTLGEAYAIRAMAHFDLLRSYGQLYIDEGENLGVAYVKNFKDEDRQKPRETIEENKKDIYADIEDAIKYLDEGSESSRAASKTNFTLDAAYALKSRVGTYFKDYDKVREASENIYGNYSVTPANNLVDYWADSEPGEASIFELEFNSDDNLGIYGLSQLFRVYKNNYGDIQAFDNLIEDANFDANDVRVSEEMIGEENGRLRNMGKYPRVGSEEGEDNIKVFRYEEVVLNYAEAMLEEDSGKAKDLLNEIAENRNADTYSEANIDNILEERRKEFVFEGFRLYDLARHNEPIRQIDENASNSHGDIESGNYKFALPIPQQEMDANTEADQNPGY